MINLSNQIALVTGASRGIGRATAMRLAQAGANVIINYLSSQSAANEVADEIEKLGRQVAVVKGDVSEPDDVKSMMEFVGETFGRLDILVSNAASGGFRSLMDATPRHFEATMKTNVQALLTLAQGALPLMRVDANGDNANDSVSGFPRRRKIIALSSHGSHRALPAYGLIGTSKAAVESLVRHLALELGNEGINVNVVLAGLVPSDSTRNLPESESMFNAISHRRLLGGRQLTAQDVADTILYLASPLSDLVQGQTLIVDGGEALHG